MPGKQKNYDIKDEDNNFTRLRKKSGKSQEKIASEVGVSVSTVRRWEKGENEPTLTVAQTKDFCEATNKKFDELPQVLTAYP